ncbi:GTP-binding protein REM 1-like [Limulus polyphemus]|uniref:GTP-binding protein REM 1-like n=1 Tax=Limulus polyphemus TaxID=6850 RepID=A0ABM1B942_LIMPO|nr:GTP-binding protein REM 1-like [Limulus polyphemus]
MPVLTQEFLNSLLNPRQLTNCSPRSTPDLRTLDDQDKRGTFLVPTISLTRDKDNEPSDTLDQQSPMPKGSLPQANNICKGMNRSQSLRNRKRPESAVSSSSFRQRIASTSGKCILFPNSLTPFRSSSNHSLQLAGDEDDFQRLRNFSVTSKGIVNRGDSFRSRSRSMHSVSSLGSEYFIAITPPRSPSIQFPPQEPSEIPPVVVTDTERFRVLVVGASEVGKSSLTTQFTTSEYICAYDISHESENEKSVTVVLNEEESELVFVEYASDKFLDQMKDLPSSAISFDAYMVVYSVTDKRSFRKSKEIINHLVSSETSNSNKAAILVGNKIDLARIRKVTRKEGQAIATAHNWKFIETSTGINHQVDELLVGILSQIRLKWQYQKKLKKQQELVTLTVPRMFSFCSSSKTKVCIRNIIEKAVLKTRSCNNLHVL